jgi:hypothetical protein
VYVRSCRVDSQACFCHGFWQIDEQQRRQHGEYGER